MEPEEDRNIHDPENTGKQKVSNDYVRYSGIGFQMLGIILAGVFGGRWLDDVLNLKFPIFTLVLTLLGVALAIYFIIKEFSGKKNS